jgi:uncharacterized protein YcaQ
MSELTLSLAGARALHLAAQGLLQPPRKKAGAVEVLAMIQQMAILQIDTISVVARSPYLVLWSRLGHYDPALLDNLLADGHLFEYWAHEACFVPIEDYRLFRHRMVDPGSMGWKYSETWLRENRDQVEKVLQHIRQHGATRSSDFERTDGKAGGWWSWKPEKRALEVLFTTGELMIARRHNFHRIYDLRERVLPSWDDAQLPPRAETDHLLQLKAVKALGLARAEWLGDYFRNAKSKPRPDPRSLVERGELLTVRVEGWDVPFYVHPDHLPLAELAAQGKLKSTVTTLLSPFDPVVWDRRRALELFNFDYRIECYTPAEKRQYGYFTLPILRAGQLIGRVDAKAHRARQVMEIKALHLEAGVRTSALLAQDLARAFMQFAKWHDCNTLQLTSTPQQSAQLPPDFAAILQTRMEGL